jgi:carotenoid cleavage dioxygenase-like enzyme
MEGATGTVTEREFDVTHYGTGGYRPVGREVFAPGLQVTGALPPELDGTFLRVGPNPMGRAGRGGRHLFSGEPMLHGVRLREGRAEWYRNRWVRTDRVQRALGGLPTPGPRHGLSDEANGNIVQHAGRTMVTGDGGALPFQIGPDLETVARLDFDGTLPAGFSAHPQLDPLTGEMFAVAYYHEHPYVSLLTIGSDGAVRRAEPIAVKNTPMMHAFSVTERYAVLYDLPVTFDTASAAGGARIPYSWDDNHGARIGVMRRGGGDADVLWMDIEPCYVFHPLNAYEAGDQLIVHVVRHERAFDRDRLRPSESAPALWRWTVDLRSGTVVEEQVDDFVEEFPRMDDRFKGSYARYGFAVGLRYGEGAALAGPALLRHDLATRQTQAHHFGPGRQTGEAVFVPRSADAPEADGWLMSLVYDRRTDRSDLVVIDTADFGGEPVATVHLPARVPHGFHAAWSEA